MWVACAARAEFVVCAVSVVCAAPAAPSVATVVAAVAATIAALVVCAALVAVGVAVVAVLVTVFQPKGTKEEVLDKEDEVPEFIEKKVKSSA